MIKRNSYSHGYAASMLLLVHLGVATEASADSRCKVMNGTAVIKKNTRRDCTINATPHVVISA